MWKGKSKSLHSIGCRIQVQTENKSMVENKYFNTAAASICLTTNMQEWFKEHVEEYLLNEVEEF